LDSSLTPEYEQLLAFFKANNLHYADFTHSLDKPFFKDASHLTDLGIAELRNKLVASIL